MKKPIPLTAISTFAIFLVMISTTTIFNVSAMDAQQDGNEEVDGYGDSLERLHVPMASAHRQERQQMR